MKNETLYKAIEQRTARSAYSRGVKEQALEMVEAAETTLTLDNVKETLLNGAASWGAYSYGGCALIMDSDIAERYCTPSELKRCKQGDKNPNSNETWLDLQGRACFAAFRIIKNELRLL